MVDFDDAVAGSLGLSADFSAVKTYIDQIDSSGGTNIGAALGTALNLLDSGAGADRARIVVLLTDGLGGYDPALTDRAAGSKATVFTVGLGAGVNDDLLRGIADGTGGKYFKVADAAQLVTAYQQIGGSLGSADGDADGLSDTAETKGWRTARGQVYKSDPKKADTDADGLTDGEEAGAVVNSSWGAAYAGISAPTAADSDTDGLTDPDELLWGTSIWSTDTDADGATDRVEYDIDSDPTARNIDNDSFNDAQEIAQGRHPMEYDLTQWEAAGAITAGFVFGDWEWGARTIGGLNDAQMEAFEDLGGQLASGIAIFGDVRDFITSSVQGNIGGAALSAAGLIPLVGDGGKFVNAAAKFAGRGAQAEKAAYRYIYELPGSMTLKRGLAARVIGTATKVFPPALRGGPATTTVYFGSQGGRKVYAGITNDINRRAREHARGLRIDIFQVGNNLTRGEARAIEQAMLIRAGGPKTKGFYNKINSISATHYYYDDALEWGQEWLIKNNISYP